MQAQQEILSLQDVSTIEIVAQIPEAIIARAEKGRLQFRVRFESPPGREFNAGIAEVATQADPVTRTYAVTFQTGQPEEGNILAGMTAEVLLKARAEEKVAFNVPVSAIFTDENGKQCVWKVDKESMTVEKAQIEVGELVSASASILSGVGPGDTIVTAGASFLNNGQTVREISDELRERR